MEVPMSETLTRHILSLCGPWEMRSADEDRFFPATVPGSVYSDLLEQGRMEDPFWRDNEMAAFDLMKKDYIYHRTFTLDADTLLADEVRLVFEGLDTLCEVSVNSRPVLSTDNMHRTYSVDVRSVLREGENDITILFRSPVQAAASAFRTAHLHGATDATRGFPSIRKAHCMYGWDWGPRLPDAGIYRPVYLWAVSTPKIASIRIDQSHAPGVVQLHFNPEMDMPSRSRPEGLYIRYTLLAPDGQAVGETCDETMTVRDPLLWWPRGYGLQPLYTLQADLFTSDGIHLDRWGKRIGLRTVELAEDPTETGTSFCLKVNGVGIFCMGADYIPEDSLLSRVTPERTRRLLEDCCLANFNCLRVWGGGYYPDDFFFDACDELGLLVWQDFMFACANYELGYGFEQNIRKEFSCVIRRLRHHPSLALWCGNNENESALAGTPWFPTTPRQKADYIKIFEYSLPSMLEEMDPQRIYRPSSPSSGGSFDQPGDDTRGDVHYWDVWHGSLPFHAFRDHAFSFVSEFGFQSFPCMKTVESFTLPEDRNPFSYIMEKHQRNADANGKILQYMSRTYLYPSSMDLMVYASQLLQAEAIRCGVEAWRSRRGSCSGAIYWQLNDIWPVASWASIDYFGRWKALHYMARRFFAPLLLICEEQGLHTLRPNVNDETPPQDIPLSCTISVSNESMRERAVQVRCRLMTGRDTEKQAWTYEARVPSLSSIRVAEQSFPQADPRRDFLFVEMMEEGRTVSSTSVLFCAPKHFAFEDPCLTVSAGEDGVTVTSRGYARMVEVECLDGDVVLSDNDFDMLSGKRTLRILRGQGNRFRVRSVYDIH